MTAADHVDAAYINPTIDAGITPLQFAVMDQVWLDVNGDGVQQVTEPGAGATVSLLSADGAVLATTRATDAEGKYAFTDLAAGPLPSPLRRPAEQSGLHRAQRRLGSEPWIPTSIPRPD